uniref:Ulp1 protease family, C-terminal catalytic domain containing protein n=1 Tax=Solanum tuberosum TaxID=4113 RepID=M1DUA4_SOLTU
MREWAAQFWTGLGLLLLLGFDSSGFAGGSQSGRRRGRRRGGILLEFGLLIGFGASFSIGVTQSISSNTNRIYDSDDDKWVENRSKILYNPLAMKKNQSIFKSNKEASSSSKSNIVKKKNLKREGKQHRQSPGLHCPKNIGLYVATFAEFLSDQINMSQDGFLLEYLCNRYATLLWRYGIDKANDGYVSENDDSPKLMGQSTPPLEKDLVHLE